MVVPKRGKGGKGRAALSTSPVQNGYTFRFMCTVQGEGGVSHFMAPEENNRGTPSQVLAEQPPVMYPRKHWTRGERLQATNWRLESELYEKIGRPTPTEAFTRHQPAARVKVPSCPSNMIRKSDAARPNLMVTMSKCWAERKYIPSAAFRHGMMIALPETAVQSSSSTALSVLRVQPEMASSSLKAPKTPARVSSSATRDKRKNQTLSPGLDTPKAPTNARAGWLV